MSNRLAKQRCAQDSGVITYRRCAKTTQALTGTVLLPGDDTPTDVKFQPIRYAGNSRNCRWTSKPCLVVTPAVTPSHELVAKRLLLCDGGWPATRLVKRNAAHVLACWRSTSSDCAYANRAFYRDHTFRHSLVYYQNGNQVLICESLSVARSKRQMRAVPQ